MIDIEKRADHEIELIEQDESLTEHERAELIREVIREARELMCEQNMDEAR